MNIQRDARVETADGAAGRVTHVIVDPRSREVTDLVIRHDGADWQVPVSAVQSVEGDLVRLHGHTSAVFDHRFNRDAYQPVDNGETPGVSAAPAHHDGTEDTVQVDRATRASVVPDEGGDYRLQLREERLRVEKVAEQLGAVRLTRRVIERVEKVEVPLREERIVIEVLPNGGGKVQFEGKDLAEGEVVEVVVYEERLNVEKHVVVNEDVRVRKEMVEHTERVQETLRKEELVVDDPDHLVSHLDQPTDPDREEWSAARASAGLSGAPYEPAPAGRMDTPGSGH
jgi:uncharacterized protein (TIGR02271 family)